MPSGSASAAHPRSRGENDPAFAGGCVPGGSSPLTRGKRRFGRGLGATAGLIPAHAGKTDRVESVRCDMPAHPRSRGENFSQCSSARLSAGSSPLTRGKPRASPRRRSYAGLIPAHAGKTTWPPVWIEASWAHPRSRGENAGKAKVCPLIAGSSPLTRGKHMIVATPGRMRGLIPAHAGKTRSTPSANSRDWAHPRSRGENPFRLRSRAAAAGSSPLTRGKLPRPAEGTDRERLIPAHAGKTHPSFGTNEGTPAHPRSRGENLRVRQSGSVDEGSSPLTRGKRHTQTADKIRARLIPAHAGKTE